MDEEDIMLWWKSKLTYSEQSPSCLVWKKNGKFAGYLNPNGYWYLGSYLNGKRISTLGHRIVYFIHHAWGEGDIDHKDGSSINNKITNLRLVPTKVNCRNNKMRCDNKTSCTGVLYEPPSTSGRTGGRYRAIWVDSQGKKRVKNFPLSRFGCTAFESAVRFRYVKELQSLGEGYTDRHGEITTS